MSSSASGLPAAIARYRFASSLFPCSSRHGARHRDRLRLLVRLRREIGRPEKALHGEIRIGLRIHEIVSHEEKQARGALGLQEGIGERERRAPCPFP